MSQDDLANAAGLTKQGISKIEDGSVQPREGTIADISRVFREKGIEFTENEGVRLKSSGLEVFEGLEQYDEFYDFMYHHLKTYGGDVCLNIYDENLPAKYRKDPEIHRNRMRELVGSGKVGSFRILAAKSDFDTFGYAQFKRLEHEQPLPTGFYAFGDCLALLSFIDPKCPYVVVIKSGPMTEAYRQGFNIEWAAAQQISKR
jgi:DNA-binding XRE family transcriptional regulator